MKKGIWLLTLLIVAAGLSAQTTVSFNFSAASQPVSGWINVAGDPQTAVRSATDGTTGISISSIGTSNWAPSDVNAYDGLGAAGGTFFPAAVMLNHWFQYGGPAAVYNASVPQLKISQLHADSVYTLRMAGSSTSSANSNPTTYTVSGLTVSVPIAVNSHNNTADGAVFTGIQPDASGNIYIYVNTLASTDVADICGVQITCSGAGQSTGGGGGGGHWIYNNGVLYDSVDNVAIGTSNPFNYKLAVNGTAIFTKVKVKTFPTWPDYVFQKDYALPSLPEVERYILEHKHLPGIAAAGEVRAQGLDLGDHAAALLQKVEELTLYLIQKDKVISGQQRLLMEQQARLDTLQKEMEALKALISAKK